MYLAANMAPHALLLGSTLAHLSLRKFFFMSTFRLLALSDLHAGIVAALAGAAEVVATDLKDNLALLDRNIQSNGASSCSIPYLHIWSYPVHPGRPQRPCSCSATSMQLPLCSRRAWPSSARGTSK